jgi:sugar phosphate isomerase/epimerase
MTRRELGKAALAALPASTLLAKPNSKFGGVQIGAITYCFRSMPSSAEDILKYCLELGLSSVEMMSDSAETYAGAPAVVRPQMPPRPAGGSPPAARKGGGRPAMTAEQKAAMAKAAEERKKWRLSVSMDRYKALRKLYNDAGVKIDTFKLGLTEAMSDDEFDYVFNVTKALGATSTTLELPNSETLTKRIGEFATKHKIFVGYHNHMQVNEHSWDTALAQSKYNTLNLDVGHFSEAIDAPPIDFLRKHASRISSIHLKDKKLKRNGGGNVPWGQGETQLKELLQVMKKEKYRFAANIELEYNIPEGSTVMAEMAKCIQFCKDALS